MIDAPVLEMNSTMLKTTMRTFIVGWLALFAAMSHAGADDVAKFQK